MVVTLRQLCPAAHDVLIEERSFYLAQQVQWLLEKALKLDRFCEFCAYQVARFSGMLNRNGLARSLQQLSMEIWW